MFHAMIIYNVLDLFIKFPCRSMAYNYSYLIKL